VRTGSGSFKCGHPFPFGQSVSARSSPRAFHPAHRCTELTQQRFALRRSDPGQFFENRRHSLLGAKLALELDCEAMRLVAHVLEQEQATRARGQHHGVHSGRREDALRLEPTRSTHTRGCALQISLFGKSDRVSLQARVAQRGQKYRELAAPPIDHQQIGQRLGIDPRETPLEDFAEAGEIVVGSGFANPIAAVIRLANVETS